MKYIIDTFLKNIKLKNYNYKCTCGTSSDKKDDNSNITLYSLMKECAREEIVYSCSKMTEITVADLLKGKINQMDACHDSSAQVHMHVHVVCLNCHNDHIIICNYNHLHILYCV